MAENNQQIYSPMPSGSGAIIVHRCLEQSLSNYKIKPLAPKLTVLPPLVSIFKERSPSTIHSTVELISYLSYPEQYRVATIHNYYLDHEYTQRCDFYRQAYYKTLLRHQFMKGLRRAHRIVAVSNTTRDLVLSDIKPGKEIRHKITTVINGVDCHHFKPTTADKDISRFNILFAGNPIPRKGWPLIASIAGELPEHCQIYCTTGMRDLHNLPKRRNITYIPKVSHAKMPEIYQQVDALLLPSYREGLSLVLLEAMACGLPIIGFNISSMPEAVKHGKGGFLVEPGNHPQILKAIFDLASQPQQRTDFGAYNRERCLLDFNLRRMTDEYRQIFRDGKTSM